MSSNSDSPHRFNSGDTGKRVVTSVGDVVGNIDQVKGGKAYVTPEPGLLDGHGSIISRNWVGIESLPLDEQMVKLVTEEAVVLKAIESENRATTETRSKYLSLDSVS